ncbi:MAG: PQQ-binding-like beta-propeller repeat protein [Haloarculaceae archaeon]
MTRRRRVLGSLGAAAALSLAGCGEIADVGDGGEACPPYDPIRTDRTAWTNRYGGAANTATAAAEGGPGNEPTAEWRFPIETHVGYHTPVVADGTVYVHDLDERLWAVDAETGDAVWRRGLELGWLGPGLGDETLVVPLEAGLVGLDAADGSDRWRALEDLPTEIGGASPLVADGAVFVPLGVSLYALDLATGEIRWRFPTGLPSESMPAVADGTISFAGDDTYVYALDAADGTERWRTKTDARIEASVTVAGELVLAATEAGTVYALDRKTGGVRWTSRLPQGPEAVATDGSRVYLLTDDRLTALAVANGHRCWRNAGVSTRYLSGVAVCDGQVYTLHRDGLVILDAASGDERGVVVETGLLKAGPAVAGGALYAISRDELVRYR